MYFIYQDSITVVKYHSSQKYFLVNEVNSIWGKNFVWLSTFHLSSSYNSETVFSMEKNLPKYFEDKHKIMN